MPLNTRPLIRASRLSSLACQPQAPRAFYSSGARLPGGTLGEASPGQAAPLGPYYEAILNKPQPIPAAKPEEPPTSSPKSPRTTVRKIPARKPKESTDEKAAVSPSGPQTSAQPATAQEKARIIFGSRLVGPAERAERLAAIRNRSTLIAGVLVPPRPEEPDNCCMSGCVNCVWDRFRDDMEEWVAASARAEAALQARQSQTDLTPDNVVEAVRGAEERMPGRASPTSAVSMDDDGGGSETNWKTDLKMADQPKIAKDLWDDDLYKNVPVGIREFMKQEKKLKEKHIKEGTFGA
ncbi:oxidoreductase-like protein [Annulohypoxylon maeteangense]|uniref:oxidoreductase-like protein n=1 Tax=Annulohypoxylon maeteangense TaxID=1927788 RepID=UPI0020087EFD|nr:oxidoreductase-like protein [Annulohypoxylon maeteangense]KAI0888512.1 oxidoreductase-like protein [Annulohypoxylon maeteangense]